MGVLKWKLWAVTVTTATVVDSGSDSGSDSEDEDNLLNSFFDDDDDDEDDDEDEDDYMFLVQGTLVALLNEQLIELDKEEEDAMQIGEG